MRYIRSMGAKSRVSESDTWGWPRCEVSAQEGYRGGTLWGLGSQSPSCVRRVTTCGVAQHGVLNPEQGEEDIHLEDILMWGGRTQGRWKRVIIKSLNKIKKVSMNRIKWQLRWETGYIYEDWYLKSLKMFLSVY